MSRMRVTHYTHACQDMRVQKQRMCVMLRTHRCHQLSRMRDICMTRIRVRNRICLSHIIVVSSAHACQDMSVQKQDMFVMRKQRMVVCACMS